jgi:hypothetical protein
VKLDENIFGKARGRYDEVMASRQVRDHAVAVAHSIMAMSRADREVVDATLQRITADLPPHQQISLRLGGSTT